MLKEDIEHLMAARQVEEEVEKYKRSLEATKTKYRIIEEKKLDDDSYVIKIKKQYSTSPVGDYLD